MESKRPTSDQQMSEIRAKQTASISASETIRAVPPRTTSIDGTTTRRPPLPKPPIPEDRHEASPKPLAKDSSTNASHKSSSTLADGQNLAPERPPRPASTEPKSRSRKASTIDASPRTYPQDDFVVIEKPAPAAVKPDPKDASLLAKITGNTSRKPDSQAPQDPVAEVHRRDQHIAELRSYIHKLEERMVSQDHEISVLNTVLADTEHKLDLTRQDLNASRAFVSTEGTADAQNLIKRLRELNSAIDDFAFRFTQEALPESATSAIVTRKGLTAFANGYYGAVKLATFINIAYSHKVTVGDFLHPFVCYALCQRLSEIVFEPFVPGLDHEMSNVFKMIYATVNSNEPQDKSGRWRALTFSSVYRTKDMVKYAEKGGDDFLHKLIDAVNYLIGPDHKLTFEDVQKELGDTARSIFIEACKFQEMACTNYLSFDYVPFLPPLDQSFHSMLMETAQEVRQGGKGTASTAILTIGLGLQAWKSVVREDKSISRDINVAVKATVLCGNWDPTSDS